MKLILSPDSSLPSEPPQSCTVCGKLPALYRVPFAVGRQETPPLPEKQRLFHVGPLRKKFVQRHRWVWSVLRLCRECGSGESPDRIWAVIQNHPSTRQLVAQGYTETRLDPGFRGGEGEVTFTEEPV